MLLAPVAKPSFLEYGGLAHTQVQPLQVLSNLADSIGGEVGTWAPPVDNLRDRTLRDAWTDYDGILESLPVGVTNFDDGLQDPNCDYDEDMGSTFTAGGNVSSVSGADYDSRGNLRNGFVALLLSDNSDGDGVCGDDDEARSNGDGVRDDGDGVRGDGDGVRGDDRDVHRDTAGDVEHGWRELSDDAQNLGDGEHEVLVGGGDGEHGGDEHDEAELDDERHEDDPSTVDGRLSLELDQLIVEAAEKMLRQTPRNSIDTWVLYRRLLRYRLYIIGRDRRFHGYLLYGDPAYGQTDVISSPFDKMGATREEIEVNGSLSKVRISVEWMFGKIIGEWAMMDFKRKMSIGNVPAGMLYGQKVSLANLQFTNLRRDSKRRKIRGQKVSNIIFYNNSIQETWVLCILAIIPTRRKYLRGTGIHVLHCYARNEALRFRISVAMSTSPSELLVTVVFGKRSTRVALPAQAPRALALLQSELCACFQLEPTFQRLVLRGRDVVSASQLSDGCKLLLLRSRAFHEQPNASKAVAGSATACSIDPPAVPTNAASKAAPGAPEMDANELEDGLLLVQVLRGKSRYDAIFPLSGNVLDVKKKVSAVLGLSSPQALRLVVKGKTPKDETELHTLATKRTVKAMALLHARQHEVQEKEEELRELLNDLARAQAALQRVQRQMARNFTSREESLFELSRVLDEGQRIAANLELVKQHLGESKATGPRASEQTIAAVTQAIGEATELAGAAQGLLETHSTV
ncbi:unnamed protein product [Phytophthora fragariaefolia]|uniref:Unnamed protein product n=1 Tax=Phytophthora fragariaefolia TaxID=1490495 RepID=A0A9W7D1C1_9STRA|nr:unnamed protein product [Phytophthora fragariaefolia]